MPIEAVAPVRICDIGGWTDTWFGGPGRVVNIAVFPGVEVTIRPTVGSELVTLDIEAFGERYAIHPRSNRVARHPLVEAAIDASPPPEHLPVEIRVRSDMPPGSGTGTSAALSVALLAALAAVRSEERSPRELATEAHRLEVEVLGLESGIQDQLSAAFGGMNYIEIDSYPEATVHPLPAWPEMESLLTLIYLGQAHASSALHRRVIDIALGKEDVAFSTLRSCALAGRAAALSQNLADFGESMIANTEAQRSLLAALVGIDAEIAIGVAAEQGALGWKINGAGGEGGSLTILSATQGGKQQLERRLGELDSRYRVLPLMPGGSGVLVRGTL